MIYEFLEPDYFDDDIDESPRDYDEGEYYDDEEAIDIASFNYECRVYGEPERQIHWRV